MVIVMTIDNGNMFPLARMERECPQSGRGRGQEIVSLFMFITIASRWFLWSSVFIKSPRIGFANSGLGGGVSSVSEIADAGKPYAPWAHRLPTKIKYIKRLENLFLRRMFFVCKDNVYSQT